jgi:hypothetical protein
MMDKLSSFADWYLSSHKALSIPALNSIHFMDDLTAVTLFRKDDFQVELVICKPNSEIPDHIHPNVDSFEVYISGSIMFRHQKELKVPKEIADSITWDGFSESRGMRIRVKPDDWHGATIGESGGCFLSIQQWLNNIKPTTVGHDWRGESLGPVHKETMHDRL